MGRVIRRVPPNIESAEMKEEAYREATELFKQYVRDGELDIWNVNRQPPDGPPLDIQCPTDSPE